MILQIEINKRDRLYSRVAKLKDMLYDGTISGTNRVDRTVTNILSHIDQLQSLNIMISQALSKISVPIGDTEIPLTMAIEIRNTLKEKIDVLDVVIQNNDDIDVMDTIINKNRIETEYDNMCDIITMTSWKTELSSIETTD